ncbi:MAG: hypothetical protein GXY01_10965 [Clostridiales bacterium]|jgi:hypothetical protein|nr:hypothetical protein [Clostridiales bacterium]
MIILLISIYAIIVFAEVPGLIKKKSWKELTVFSVITAVAFTISLLHILKVEIPDPAKDTQYFVKSLFPFSYD